MTTPKSCQERAFICGVFVPTKDDDTIWFLIIFAGFFSGMWSRKTEKGGEELNRRRSRRGDEAMRDLCETYLDCK